MNNLDKQYFQLINHILENGYTKGDRTGTGTKSVFGYTIRHKMSEGFPVLTSKKVYFKGVVHELLWFLKGETNIKYLVDNDVNIWNGDAYKNYAINQETHNTLTQGEFIAKLKQGDKIALEWAELGPVYGAQWRNWGGKPERPENLKMKDLNGNIFPGQEGVDGIDQIKNLINDLRKNPDSRRLMVSAWNVDEIDSMVLPPCHYVFQCYTRELTLQERAEWWCKSVQKNIHYADDLEHSNYDKMNVPKRALSLKFSMRSVDVPLGLPFNLASYGLLLQILANEVNMVSEELIFSGGDCHIYLNQIDGIKKQLNQQVFELPSVEISTNSIFDLEYNDIKLKGYKSSESVKMPLSN